MKYQLIIIEQTQINKNMQIKQPSPSYRQPEHEFNFKVKVNYQNGAVSIHGPSGPTIGSETRPAIPQRVLTVPMQNPPIQIFPPGQVFQPMPIARKIAPQPGSFSNSTASQSYTGELNARKILKTSSDIFASQANSPINYPPNFTRTFSQGPKNLQSSNIYEMQIQRSKQQIDCVICQRKFSAKEFDFHLQLHRSPKKRMATQPISNTKSIFPIIPIQNSFTRDIELNEKLKQNSIKQQSRPELLYSFQKKSNNSFGQIINSQQNSKVSSIRQQSMKQSQPVSLNSSIVHSSSRSMPKGQAPIIQVQSGIRYLNSQVVPNQIINNSILSHQSRQSNSVRSSQHQNSAPFSFNTNDLSRGFLSVKSSQISMPRLTVNGQLHQSFHQGNQNRLPPTNGDRFNTNPNEIKVNPFDLIEQQESKVYEYFPQPGNMTLSQHRVQNPINGGFGFKNPVPQPLNINIHNLPNRSSKLLMRQPQNESIHIIGNQNQNASVNIQSNRQDAIDLRSEAQESSISSIHQYRQPLQKMNKQEMIKNFHSKRNRLNLTNIVGMSQVLAREGFNSSQRVKTQHFAYSGNRNSNSHMSKTITARSVIIRNGENEHQRSNDQIFQQLNRREMATKELNSQNMEMIPIQGRQIFRGTQVEEDDFRGFESVMNVTRSSKSSNKTKIPRNYLAVNDFINSNSESRKL